jgi:hypothetical protein
MDPGNPEWRTFWIERARQYQASLGGTAISRTTSRLALGKFDKRGIRRHCTPTMLPTRARYRASCSRFIPSSPNPKASSCTATLSSLRDRCLAQLHAIHWMAHCLGRLCRRLAHDYYDVARWEQQLDYLTDTSAPESVSSWLPRENKAITTASNLPLPRTCCSLKAAGLPLHQRCCYRVAWPYDNTRIDLGHPLVSVTRRVAVWKRDYFQWPGVGRPGCTYPGISLNGADQ